MPIINLPDGNKIEFPKKVTGIEIAEKIGKSLAKQALIISVNGELKDLTYEITNLVWDLVNVYQVDIYSLAKENKSCINFDPQIFIAASYKPFKDKPLEENNFYKGSFNIFGSKRSVYTGSKSVEEFKEASNRLLTILSPYTKIPNKHDYKRLIDYELKIKLQNRLKRKNKIPGRRGRRPRTSENSK